MLKYCYADLFADDTTVHNNSPDIDEINEEMLIDFLKIVGRSKQNKLPINFNKSTYMILGAKRRMQDAYELLLNIDDEKIEKVSRQKLLGIIIDEHLTCRTPHIDYLCSNIATKISLLKQLSSYLPQNIQKLFYQRYARIILQAEYLTPSSHMFGLGA